MLAPLAIREQLRLGLLRLTEPVFIADALQSESIMRVAIDYAVREPDPWSVGLLTTLFNACVATNRPGAVKGFLDRLGSYGAVVIEDEDQVLISTSDGLQRVIKVRRELLDSYVMLRWNRGIYRGFEIYQEALM
jgi:hypothetical protein